MQVYDLYFKIMTSLDDDPFMNLQNILPNFISKCGPSEVQLFKPENKLGTILTRRYLDLNIDIQRSSGRG